MGSRFLVAWTDDGWSNQQWTFLAPYCLALWQCEFRAEMLMVISSSSQISKIVVWKNQKLHLPNWVMGKFTWAPPWPIFTGKKAIVSGVSGVQNSSIDIHWSAFCSTWDLPWLQHAQRNSAQAAASGAILPSTPLQPQRARQHLLLRCKRLRQGPVPGYGTGGVGWVTFGTTGWGEWDRKDEGL